MTALGRYLVATGLLVGTTVPTTMAIGRRYDSVAARRFCTGMAATIGAQQVLVGLAVLRSGDRSRDIPRHQLGAVDLMTLSRGCASAILAGPAASRVRDRAGAAG